MPSEKPTCPLSGDAMRHWIHMPIDCRKAEPCSIGDVYRCERCQYGAIFPRPHPEMIPGFYELDKYYTHDRSHMAEPGPVSLLDKLRVHVAWRLDFGLSLNARRVHRLLGGVPSKICDVGCGNGDFAEAIGRLGHQVTGVEPDPEAVSSASRKNFEILQGTAEDLPEELGSRTFDCSVMRHVLEHCLDPLRAVANVRSLLRPGGTFMCEVPNNASRALSSLGVVWEMLDVPRHLNFFCERSLRLACEKSDLSVKDVYHWGFSRQFRNEWINTESRTWDALQQVEGKPVPRAIKNTKLRAWSLLLATAFASQRRKYDSVGVIAERRG